MIVMGTFLDRKFYYTIEWWEENVAYLKLWESNYWRSDRMIREVICNGMSSALAEAQHWLDETIFLKLQNRADGKLSDD